MSPTAQGSTSDGKRGETRVKPAGNGEKRHEKASIFTSPPVPWCHGAPAAPARQGRGAGAQAAATAGAIASRSRDIFHEFSICFRSKEVAKRRRNGWKRHGFQMFSGSSGRLRVSDYARMSPEPEPLTLPAPSESRESEPQLLQLLGVPGAGFGGILLDSSGKI